MGNTAEQKNEEVKTEEAQEVKKPKLTLATPASTEEASLEVVMDIPLRVSVELGRAKILVQDLLKLHKGSVIELNKLAGESLEVLVNNRVVAKGEVIVVNEKFGVRLTDVVSHVQRIRQLGEE